MSNDVKDPNGILPHAVETRVRPFQIQCGSTRIEKHPSYLKRFYTWLVCGKDPFGLDWTAPAGNMLATALFIADLVSDFTVAWYHFDQHNYGYAGISFGIFIFPIILSIGYYSVYKKYPWYFAHPFEPIYWFKKSYAEYRRIIEQRKHEMGREDAWLHYNSVKNFRTSNWARVSAVRLQIHLSALPQMIFQCYTVNELLHDRELKKISWFSWISIALSTISLSMYHHTLALAQDKTLDRDHDQENASRTSPSILFDLIGQGILDGIYIVSRAVVLSCFFTVNPPWLSGLCFLTFHLTTAFLLMYHAGPAAVNEFTPDFRLILYNRTNHPDIITAAVASLVFPPLMNIHFKEGKERFYHPWLSSASRTFWIAAMLLMLETEAMMLFWVRLNSDHVPSHARTLTMAVITGAMIFVLLGHVLYVTFIYIPFKRREQLKCCRNHGIIAKCWFLETAENHYYYVQDQLMQRLINTGFTAFSRKTSCVDIPTESSTPADERNCEEGDQLVRLDNLLAGSQCNLTTDDLTWITETLRVVTDRDGNTNDGPKWQRKQFFRTMILPERILANRIARYAQRQLDEVVRFGTVLDTGDKIPLIQECKRLITFWSEVVFRCITHQQLPAGMDDVPAHDYASQMLEWYTKAIRTQPETITVLTEIKH